MDLSLLYKRSSRYHATGATSSTKLTQFKLKVTVQRVARRPVFVSWEEFGFNAYYSFVLCYFQRFVYHVSPSRASMLPELCVVLIEELETSD